MGVYKKKGEWWIDFYFEGSRKRKCIGPVKAMAEEALAAVKADIVRGTFGLKRAKRCPTFKEFAGRYYQVYSESKRPNTKERDRLILKRFCDFIKNKRLSQITEFDLKRFQTERQLKVSKLSVNRELSGLRHVFNVAIREGHITDSPMQNVKAFKVEYKKQHILSEDEMRRLLEATGRSQSLHLHSICVVAINTAMRRQEILDLEWNDLDFFQNGINVKNTKAGRDRWVPMSPELRDMFLKLPSMGKSDYVFPDPRTGKPHKRFMRDSFDVAKKRAGIEKFRFHDFRHNAATHMLRNGGDIVTVQEILGHSSITLTRRYCQSNSALKAKAVSILGKFLKPRPDGHLSAENGPKSTDVGISDNTSTPQHPSTYGHLEQVEKVETASLIV